MKRIFLALCLVMMLTGCGSLGGVLPESSSGGPESSGAAEQKLSAEAELRGEELALTLHGYYMGEISAADLQVLRGITDLDSAGKILEALRRAAEQTEAAPFYHAEDITVLIPTTEEGRKSGLSPRELAGTVHGWQDAAGEFNMLLSAGNEIFWLHWSTAPEAEGAALITGKWGD